MACSANHSKGSGHGSSSAHGAQHGGGLIVGPGAWLQRKVHLRPQHRGVHLVTDEILRGVSAHQFGNVHKCRDTPAPPLLAVMFWGALRPQYVKLNWSEILKPIFRRFTWTQSHLFVGSNSIYGHNVTDPHSLIT